MRIFQALASGAALTTFGVMVAGAYVKALGEGAACPPGILCAESAAEMLHRALVGVLGLLVLGMLALAFKNRKEDRRTLGLCAGALSLLLLQALLGQAAIAAGLNPVVVTAHQALALAVFALLLYIAFRARHAPAAGAGSA